MTEFRGKMPVNSQSSVASDKKNHELSAGAKLARNVFLMLLGVIDALNPVGMLLFGIVEKAFLFMKEHHLNPLVQACFGIAICFFGGFFTLLITAVEVIRLTIWDSMKANLSEIYKNYCAARDANKRDNMVDDNLNGIPDVHEIDKDDLFSRKLWLFCNSVDPLGLQQAIRGLLFSLVAVLTSLSGKFTICLTCGCTIADFLRKSMPLDETIAELLPPQQKKLAGTISGGFFYIFGIIFALLLQQYIMTARNAIRGAQICMEHLINLGKERGVVKDDLACNTNKGKLMIFGLAFLGFFWQVSHNFLLPFPLNILLFPLSCTEWALGILIRYFSVAQFK